MARTTGPLLSLGGSGAIAKTQVYSTWRGIPYVRQYTKPANPNSVAQQSTRVIFSFLNSLWKLAPANVQVPWTANAKGKQFTDRNKFIGDNVKLMRGETDLEKLVLSPGANGGMVAGGLVNTPGTLDIDAVLTAPDLPSGWAITQAVFACIADADPTTDTPPAIQVATDATAPYEHTFTVAATGDYLVSAWFVYTKSDSKVAYGPALSELVTVT
jgi:hypothetical protein